MRHQLYEGSLRVVRDSSVIAPLRIEGLREQIDALGERWLRKLEFHMTVISAATLERAGGGRPDLWEVVTRVAAGRAVGPIVVREEVRRVRDPEEPGLRTLIVMVEAARILELHEDLSAALGASLRPPPTHVTLYSSDPVDGIGIDDERQLAERAPPLTEDEQRAVREAMSFDGVFFDDGGFPIERDPGTLPVGDTDAVFTPSALCALSYAAHVHAEQRRKGGEVPYLAHLLSVAARVAEEGGDETEVIGALLHDAAEDHGGGQRLEDIRRRFGPRVEKIVRALSDSLAPAGAAKAPWRTRKERYVEHLRDERDESVLRVSNADKVDNARAIVRDHRLVGARVWERFEAPPEQQLAYYRALSSAFSEKRPGAPLALELAGLVSELEALTGY